MTLWACDVIKYGQPLATPLRHFHAPAPWLPPLHLQQQAIGHLTSVGAATSSGRYRPETDAPSGASDADAGASTGAYMGAHAGEIFAHGAGIGITNVLDAVMSGTQQSIGAVPVRRAGDAPDLAPDTWSRVSQGHQANGRHNIAFHSELRAGEAGLARVPTSAGEQIGGSVANRAPDHQLRGAAGSVHRNVDVGASNESHARPAMHPHQTGHRHHPFTGMPPPVASSAVSSLTVEEVATARHILAVCLLWDGVKVPRDVLKFQNATRFSVELTTSKRPANRAASPSRADGAAFPAASTPCYSIVKSRYLLLLSFLS